MEKTERMSADEYRAYLAREALAKVRAHKYGAERTEVDGISFASKAEAARYAELRALESAGEIRGLVLQPRFVLQEKFTDAWGAEYGEVVYVSDFQYEDVATGDTVVEDVKGYETPAWRIKKKLFAKAFPALRLRVTN